MTLKEGCLVKVKGIEEEGLVLNRAKVFATGEAYVSVYFGESEVLLVKEEDIEWISDLELRLRHIRLHANEA